MIDFRYHLVSLVAVFIALAVGIALGAGPLREGISSTLESEVAQLREERTDLRAQVEHANRQAEAKDEAIALSSDRTSAGTLEGVRVGLVVLPGADRNVVDALEGRLTAADGSVVLMAEIEPRWESPNPPADRQQLVDDLALQVAAPGTEPGREASLATVLAATLAGAEAIGQPGAWLSVATTLEDERLVDFTWRDTQVPAVVDRRPPEALVVVAGGLSATAATEGAGAAVLEQRLELVEALVAMDLPTVVGGVGGEALEPDDTGVDPLVQEIRQDDTLAEQVSTTDNLETAAGRLSATLALAWAVQDEHGHYGLGQLARAPFPEVPPARAPVEDPAPEGTAPGTGPQEGDGQGGGLQDDGLQDGSDQQDAPGSGDGGLPGDGDSSQGDAGQGTGTGAVGDAPSGGEAADSADAFGDPQGRGAAADSAHGDARNGGHAAGTGQASVPGPLS